MAIKLLKVPKVVKAKTQKQVDYRKQYVRDVVKQMGTSKNNLKQKAVKVEKKQFGLTALNKLQKSLIPGGGLGITKLINPLLKKK